MKKIFLIFLVFGFIHANAKKDILAKALLSASSERSCSFKNPVKEAEKYLGTRYLMGSSTKTTRSFDCSSFVKHVIKKSTHKNLPRTAASQYKKVTKVKIPHTGDLIFFKNTYKHGISHVGIYIGNNKFIHASSAAHKVTISSTNKHYYKKHFAGYGRV
jgi:peptidoglycan endopeptidase LytE